MNMIKKIKLGIELGLYTIEMEQGHYDNNVFDKITIIYRFISDCIKMK